MEITPAPLGRTPLIGEKIPELSLKALQGNEEKIISLASFRGRWLVLFFYPADFTFVCPTELEDMADHFTEFEQRNCEVVSISCDTVFVHKAWHDHSAAVAKVNFPMVADPTGALSKSLGVYDAAAGLALRASFLINPEGVIEAYEVHADGIGRNAAELLRKLQAAQFVYEHGGQVCPARWQPGRDTIKKGLDMVGKI